MHRFAAAAAVILIGLTPACAKASAQERVAHAADATAAADSARVAMTMSMSNGGHDVPVRADGVVDFGSLDMAMTMDLSQVPDTPPGMDDVEMLSIGSAIYMQIPDHEQLNFPTPWIKMDLEDLAGQRGMDNVSQLNNNNPAKTMELLRGASDDVEELGVEDVRGTTTTHYRGTIHVGDAVAAGPANTRKETSEIFEGLGLQTIPVEVWLDDDGFLRRQKMTMDMRPTMDALDAGADAPTTAVIDMEFYDFGVEVDVAPPPADDVTDLLELQGG